MKSKPFLLLYSLVLLQACGDTMTSQKGQTLSVPVTAFSNGSFIFKTPSGLSSSVHVSTVQSILFDSPKVSHITSRNGQVVKGVITKYENEQLEFVDDDENEQSVSLRAVSRIQFNVENIVMKPLKPTGETIEKVFLFPEEYVGKTIVFSHCKVATDLSKDDLLYFLEVESPGGKIVFPRNHTSEGFGFAVEPAFAKILAEEAQGGVEWIDVTISCRLEKGYMFHDRTAYVAIVDKMDMYNRGGKIAVSYKSPGPDSSCLFGLGLEFSKKAIETDEDPYKVVCCVTGASQKTFKQGDKTIDIPDGSLVFAIADGNNDFVSANSPEFLKTTRGPKGSVVRMKIRPKGKSETIEVSIERTVRLLYLSD